MGHTIISFFWNTYLKHILGTHSSHIFGTHSEGTFNELCFRILPNEIVSGQDASRVIRPR